MYSPKHFRIPSALGAILAATLVTVISAVPDAVHAQDPAKTSCAEKVPYAFQPSMQ